MALETLKGVEDIGGFNVVDMNKIKDEHPEMFRPDGSMIYHLFDEKIRPYNFIYVRHDVNSISFNIQNGPLKEAGLNGCQAITLVQAARIMIDGLNKKFPSEFNEKTLEHLDKAIEAQAARTKDRERRGVEGYSKE